MQAVLWFNIIGFTIMFTALVLALLFQLRGAPEWLRYYLFYHFCYLAWLGVSTFASLNIHLLGVPPASFGITLNLLHTALSAGIIFTYPPLILKLAGTTPRPGLQAAVYLLPTLLITASIVTTFYPITWLLFTINIVYNAFLLLLSFFGLRALRRQTVYGLRAVMKIFLRLSVLLYLFAVLSTPLFWLLPRAASTALGIFFNGLFCFIWGSTMTIHLIRRFTSPEFGQRNLPDSFKESYRITRREEEILEQLLAGRGSRQIGETLFISQRTVETHLHNLYRKTKTGNRLELINRIHSF